MDLFSDVSLVESFQKERLERKESDVVFQVPKRIETSTQEQKQKQEQTAVVEFSCIRALFAMQSDVLNSMLYGKMMESQAKLIKIDDINSSTFYFLRSYVYGLFPSLTHENIVSVLYASEKYLLKQLKNVCIKTICKEYVNLKNVNCTVKDHLSDGSNENNILLQLLIELYKIGLIDVIRTDILPVLHSHVKKNGRFHQIVEFIHHKNFSQLPLRLFELLIFEDKINLISIFEGKITDNDVNQVCVEWSKQTAKSNMNKQLIKCFEFFVVLCLAFHSQTRHKWKNFEISRNF